MNFILRTIKIRGVGLRIDVFRRRIEKVVIAPITENLVRINKI